MSPSGVKLNPAERLEVIRRTFTRGQTQKEIAEICGCTVRTIKRDLDKWRTSGGFEKWLEAEFYRLHNIIQEEDPKLAYREVAKLKAKTMTDKTEVKAEVDGAFNLIVAFRPSHEKRCSEDADCKA